MSEFYEPYRDWDPFIEWKEMKEATPEPSDEEGDGE